ncbi:MAG: acyl--CoA ligase [Magnetococcales bacterium]|nr:acyl--CoA ligase [Magnetococcales bacterium]
MTRELDVIGYWAERQPERPALIAGGEVISYVRLQRWIGRCAARLRARGVGPGARLAVALPNGAPFVLAWLTALHAGVTLVPVNPELPPESTVQLLDIARPGAFLQEADSPLFAEGEEGEPGAPFESDTPAIGAIFFTSGTTGTPKGVCHATRTLIDNVRAFNHMVGLGPECRMLHVLPMFYMAGFLNTVLSPLVAGGAVVIAPRFTPQSALAFWKPAMEGAINSAWLTPTMLAMLTRLYRESAVARWCQEHITHLFVGTAPLPRAVRDGFAERFGIPPLESYGMTEVLLTAAHLPGQTGHDGSAGRLLPGVELLTRDGEEELRELWIATPYLMRGYWVSPELPPLLEAPEGCFPTGDCGHVDQAGYLHITGRRKDLIIRGGVNVSPRAVEEVLLLHPAVGEVCVKGVAHPVLGEEVAAWIVLKGGWEPEQARVGLLEFVRQRLVVDSAPTRWQFLAALPRNATGKVMKNALTL